MTRHSWIPATFTQLAVVYVALVLMSVSLLIFTYLTGVADGRQQAALEQFKFHVQEQTYQLRLDRACTEHVHAQPTIHQLTFDGMKHYAFDGVEWQSVDSYLPCRCSYPEKCPDYGGDIEFKREEGTQ